MSAIKRLGLKVADLPATGKYSAAQDQTKQAFGYQWDRREAYESKARYDFSRKWLVERYCDHDPARVDGWLATGPQIILDAGCGSGYSALLLFGDHLKDHDYLGVDISAAVEIAKIRFQEAGYPGDFLQASLMDLPLPAQSVDLIFSEGVLHHTDSTEKALKKLAGHLKKGGRFLFYVYAKKAVIREFTDDYIRQQLQSLTDEEAWKALEPLTKLGIALGELNVQIEVPEDIPFLGISRGKCDIQRFFFWNICKVFYRPEFSFQEMVFNNFDWFRPFNCHRQTPDEVKKWCQEAGLAIEHMNIQESGITVVAVKQ
jgi:arsenite methyltransferase